MKRASTILAASLFVAGWHSAARFFEADVYHYGRWVFWRAALRIFAAHPFGVGLGGSKYFWFQAQEPFPQAFRHYAKYAQTPHNEYLEVLVGLGFLGLLFFLFAIVPPMVAAARGWVHAKADATINAIGSSLSIERSCLLRPLDGHDGCGS